MNNQTIYKITPLLISLQDLRKIIEKDESIQKI